MDFTVVKKNLEKRGYKVSCFDTSAEAAEYLCQQVQGKTVGFGGSMTLEQMGLYEKLSENNTVFWHWRVPEGKTVDDVRAEAANTDVYFSSVNGMAETGEIVNIDGRGNRLASVFFGHKKVYLVAGENKIAPDYDGALYRARNVASPKNAKRFNVDTPCVKKGDRCYDCASPQRICRGLAVLWEAMMDVEMEVILIHEDLGY